MKGAVTGKIKIGTRSSPLALAQAALVRDQLLLTHLGLNEADIEIVSIKTTGDKIQDRRLLEKGGKGLFTKEIEEVLLAGDIDLAVHSTKDMPAELPEGLILAAFLPRENPRDAFVSIKSTTLKDLSKGARVGTASLRRQAQLLKIRPDLSIEAIRGNVETRLRKLETGKIDALVLAFAGLKRLGLEGRVTTLLSFEEMLPAPGQGAISIEAREEDENAKTLLAPIDDFKTRVCIEVERGVTKALGGSCRMPLAALARIEENQLVAKAALFSPDGQKESTAKGTSSFEEATNLGFELGKKIREKTEPGLLKKLLSF